MKIILSNRRRPPIAYIIKGLNEQNIERESKLNVDALFFYGSEKTEREKKKKENSGKYETRNGSCISRYQPIRVIKT